MQNNGVIKAIKKLLTAYKRTQDEHLLEIVEVLLDVMADEPQPVVSDAAFTWPIVGGETITVPYMERSNEMAVSAYSAPFTVTTTTGTTGMSIDATTGDITYYPDSTAIDGIKETD